MIRRDRRAGGSTDAPTTRSAGFYRLEALRREVAPVLARVDLLCVPTFPSFVTLTEIAADPIGPNARLGTYTNFVNLLGLCGLAVPTPARTDGRPGSVTLLARGRSRRAAGGLGRDDRAARAPHARRDRLGGAAAAPVADAAAGSRTRSSWRSAARTCRGCR